MKGAVTGITVTNPGAGYLTPGLKKFVDTLPGAGESQANRRYLYFANKADVEGQNDVAALFRKMAQIEAKHAVQIMSQMGWKDAARLPVPARAWAAPEAAANSASTTAQRRALR